MMIKVENLSKDYLLKKKEPGLSGALKGLITTEYKTIHAVDNLSFNIGEGEIVGFIMMGYYEAKQYYTLWKLLIDRKHQHKGYGRKALELGISFLKDRFHAQEIYTGVIPGNISAKKLYESVGFRETGVFENNMEELRLIC